jgi:hypothetical protein
MAKRMKKGKVLAFFMAFSVFCVLGIFYSFSPAWPECTSCENCPPPVIEFTSKQMSVDGQQTLTVSGGLGSYTWSKESGGGNLSGSGTSVTYTAPSSNPDDCSYDPTIRVTDSCSNSTFLKLSVNAYSPSSEVAYAILCTSCDCGAPPGTPIGDPPQECQAAPNQACMGWAHTHYSCLSNYVDEIGGGIPVLLQYAAIHLETRKVGAAIGARIRGALKM